MTGSVRRAVPIVALGVAVSAGNANADEPKHHVKLSLVASAGCTDETKLHDALALRSDKIVMDAASADRIDVDVSDRGTGLVTGTLVVTRDGQSSAPKTLEGATCEEVVRGISLVAALAFDPEAKLAPRTSEVPASPPAVPARAPGVVAPVGPSWRFGVGGGAGAWALGADGTSLAFAAFVELARDAPGLSPLFRLGLSRATATATVMDGTFGAIAADLALTVGRASACVARWDLAFGVRIRPCVGLDAGIVRGSPRAPITGDGRSRGWAAPTVNLRIEWEIARTLFVEAEGLAAFPLVRDELGAEPRITLYRAPALLPAASFSAGLRFP